MEKPRFIIMFMKPHPTSGERVYLMPRNIEAEVFWEKENFGLVRYANEIKNKRHSHCNQLLY